MARQEKGLSLLVAFAIPLHFALARAVPSLMHPGSPSLSKYSTRASILARASPEHLASIPALDSATVRPHFLNMVILTLNLPVISQGLASVEPGLHPSHFARSLPAPTSRTGEPIQWSVSVHEDAALEERGLEIEKGVGR